MRNRRNKRSSAKPNKTKKIITCSAIVASLIFFSLIFSLLNMTTPKIAKGVKINGLNLSGLTQEQAKDTIKQWYEEIVSEGINLQYEDLEESINIEELDAKTNINEVLEEAQKVGKSGNIVKDNYELLFTMLFGKRLHIEVTYDDKKLDDKIEEISSKLPEGVVQSSYYIEDENLVIKKGTAGVRVKKEELKEQIKHSIELLENKRIQIPVENAEADEIDIEKIHDEIYKEAKNAYVAGNPAKVYAHVVGVDFNISIEDAKNLLMEDKEEYTIPLKITIPEQTLDTLGWQAFPEKLSEFTTRYDASDENRSTNIVLASEKINGTIILPGETFSYNKIVGARTIAKGYKEAPIYSGGKVVPGIGGGICQLSSTLYNAVLYANLEVTTRSNHRFITSYVQAGRDATVSWGTIDFRFKNNRSYPIKVVSTVVNGLAKVEIYGMKEEKEYEVELETKILEEVPYKVTYKNDNTLNEGIEVVEQYGSNGVKSETYKILKLDGTEISRTLLSADTYSSLEKIIRKGTKKVENEIEQNDIIENEEPSNSILQGENLEND